jgi:hypothetical protein
LTGDSNVLNPIDGSFGASINSGNQNFFRNVLGEGTKVLIQNEYVPPETGSGTNALNNFYNGLSGVTSTTDYPGSEITSSLLAGIDLFVFRPRTAFTSSEATALIQFVSGAGKFLLIGENSTLDVAQASVNELLVAMGSAMRLQNSAIGVGFVTTPNINVDPLTEGVASMSYNFTNSISGGTPLVRTADASGVIIAYENFVAVPEPGSALLSGFAVMVLALRTTRRRSRLGKRGQV